MFPVLTIVENPIFMFLPQGYPFSWELNTQLLFGCFIMNLLPISIISILIQQIEHALFLYERDMQIIKSETLSLRVRLVGQINDPSIVFYVAQ